MRLHEGAQKLKAWISQPKRKKFFSQLTYITSRGKWYHTSWKGDLQKSGGVATNIGVHLFDLLIWMFGEVEENNLISIDHESVTGNLIFRKGAVNYELSINPESIPFYYDGKTYRVLTIDDERFDFTTGFENLHTKSYEEILKGNGFRISEAKPSIELVSEIRKKTPPQQLIDYYLLNIT